MPQLSVLVPSLNERDNLRTLVARTVPVLDACDGELVVVDDGSTDDSQRELERLRAEEPRLVVCRHTQRRGIPEAWHTAISAARGSWVASLDADLQYDPADVQRLLRHAHTHGRDFVQGARQRVESEGIVRLALSRGLNTALNTAFGTRALDHKSALFVCRREHFARLLEHRRDLRHWQCFIGVAARALGLSCDEVVVSFQPRQRGSSAFGAVPWRSTAEVMADFIPARRLYGGGRAQ